MMMNQNRFSLLTFNAFGGINWTTPRRLSTLGRELGELMPTAVCLQEVQSYPALRVILRAAAAFAHHAYMPAKQLPFGALLTLAQYPLSLPTFLRYSQQGAWHGPTIFDRLTQKGALVNRLEWDETPVIVINTHLIANYGANWTRGSRAARVQQSQLDELATLVNEQPRDAVLFVAGDFNIPRGNWLYHEFLEKTAMFDPLAGDIRPTYRPFPGVPVRYALPIDFVFLRIPAGLQLVTTCHIRFTEQVTLVTGARSYLSDHMAVHVSIEKEEK